MAVTPQFYIFTSFTTSVSCKSAGICFEDKKGNSHYI